MCADVIAELEVLLDGLCQAEPSKLADSETVQSLFRQVERLCAVGSRAAAAFDAGGSWETDGARSAAAWLATRCGLPLPAARRRVRVGRALRCMPATEAAWLAGDVVEASVELLVAARQRVGGEVFDPDERRLVGTRQSCGTVTSCE